MGHIQHLSPIDSSHNFETIIKIESSHSPSFSLSLYWNQFFSFLETNITIIIRKQAAAESINKRFE